MSYWKLDDKGEPEVVATKPFNREPSLTVKEILEAMKDYYEEKSCNA
jgi:hypothetical protein